VLQQVKKEVVDATKGEAWWLADDLVIVNDKVFVPPESPSL
jgi:hypothetical protein